MNLYKKTILNTTIRIDMENFVTVISVNQCSVIKVQ